MSDVLAFALFFSISCFLAVFLTLPDILWTRPQLLMRKSNPVEQRSKLCAAHPTVRAHRIWNVCSHMQSAHVWKRLDVTEVPSCSLEWKRWNLKTALLRCISLSVGYNSNIGVYKIMCDFFFFFKTITSIFWDCTHYTSTKHKSLTRLDYSGFKLCLSQHSMWNTYHAFLRHILLFHIHTDTRCNCLTPAVHIQGSLSHFSQMHQLWEFSLRQLKLLMIHQNFSLISNLLKRDIFL